MINKNKKKMSLKTPNRSSGSNFQFLYSNNDSSKVNSSIVTSPYNMTNNITSGSSKKKSDNNNSSLIALKNKSQLLPQSSLNLRTENSSPQHFTQ